MDLKKIDIEDLFSAMVATIGLDKTKNIIGYAEILRDEYLVENYGKAKDET